MKTNVRIIGGKKQQKQKRKSIQFIFALSYKDCKPIFELSRISPADYKFVELISFKSGIPFDVMFAHDGDRGEGSLFLGHFNDGIVEEGA